MISPTGSPLSDYVALYQPNLQLPENDYEGALDLYRKVTATNYITGYLLEYTLSIDNVFVILMILTAFSVDPRNYKQVLFWGVLGAIILRFIFIFVGSALIHKFQLVAAGIWCIPDLFGYTYVHSRNRNQNLEASDHWLVKFLSRHFNIYPDYIRHHFWKRATANSISRRSS